MELWDTLQETLQTFAVSLISLYIVVNPSGVSSVFVGVTRGLERPERMWIAFRAAIAGSIILAVFAIAGSLILERLNITSAALQIAGGIFIFGLAFALARGKENEYFGKLGDQTQTHHKSVAFTPLAVPMIAGPASITVVMTSAAKAQYDPYAMVALLLSIAAVGGLSLLSMWRFVRLIERRGTIGLVLPRVMGLVLAIIAVQFIIRGIELVLPRMTQAVFDAIPKPDLPVQDPVPK